MEKDNQDIYVEKHGQRQSRYLHGKTWTKTIKIFTWKNMDKDNQDIYVLNITHHILEISYDSCLRVGGRWL